MSRVTARRVINLAMALGVLVYFVVSGTTAQAYGVDVLAVALIFGLYAAGVDMSFGHGGILLLGSALFFGIGAYGMAFAMRSGLEPLLAYPLIMAVAVVVGLVIAQVGFRARAQQVQFGLIGLAISLMFERLAISAYDLTGGSNGLTGIRRPILGGVLPLTTAHSYYAFVVCVCLVALAALWLLARSAWGQAVRAVRDDPGRASSLGYDVMRIRFQVVALTSAVIALSGALFPAVSGTAYPELFGIVLNMQALVWVAIGGAATLFGPFLLAAGLRILESYLAGVWTNYYVLAIGVAFVVTVTAVPQGIGGAVSAGLNRLTRKRRPTGADELRGRT